MDVLFVLFFAVFTGQRIAGNRGLSPIFPAVNDVVPGRVGQRDQGGAGTGHGQEFKECCLFRQLKWVSFLFAVYLGN